MKKGILYGIAGGVAAIVIIAALLSGLTNSAPATVSNTTAIAAVKARIDSQIQNAAYSTISNATTPSTAIDARTGAVYVAFFRDDHDNQNGTLYIQRSDDGGKSFANPVRVNDKDGEALIGAQWSSPALAVGPSGEVYVVWYHADYSDPESFPYGQVTLRFSRSLDGGETFEAARNPAPDDPPGEQSYPYMVVSTDNNVHISYLNLNYALEEDNSGTPTVVRIVSSTNGGESFGKSVVADETACQCCATVAAMGPDNELYASSRSVFLQTSQELTNETRTDYHGDFDKVVIRDITVYHSTDNGGANSFSEPSRVGNDDWYMNGCPDAGPGMSFDSKGRMHVAWFTGSETASQGQGFYYTSSDDKGQTFTKPVPIHLLSEQWIPPTTQYLVTDSEDNSWIVFVNSEGLKKGADYAETFTYDGKGTVHLAVIDRDGNVIKNEPFATGDITKHYPYTSASDGKIALSWMDGESVKVAVVDTSATEST
jgi:hypothetical protein